MKVESEEAIQVSVLCLAYNHEKYIRRALEGFVNQKTDFKFEVLIHDDASKDKTASIIAEYVEKYPELIKPIYQSENQYSKGIKIQRTYNYPRAHGKYFAWCEGDDYWCDNLKLQKQFDAMESHPECSICVHKVQCINEDGSINSRVIPEKFYDIIGEGVLSDDNVADALWLKKEHYPFQTSSYFVRRESIEGLIEGSLNFIGFMTGDKEILRTAFSEGHIFYIKKIFSNYRLFSDESYTSRRNLLSEMDKRRSYQNKAKGDLLYDEYTSGRFHKWIIKSVSNQLVNDGAFNQALMDNFLNDVNLKRSDVLSHCSTKIKMKYYLSVYAHPIYLFLKRIRSRLKRT